MHKAHSQCGAYYEKLQKAVIHTNNYGEKGKAKHLIKMWSCIFCKVERM